MTTEPLSEEEERFVRETVAAPSLPMTREDVALLARYPRLQDAPEIIRALLVMLDDARADVDGG